MDLTQLTELKEKAKAESPWAYATVLALCEEVYALRAELHEQCRLNGKGSEREAGLKSENHRLREEVERVRAENEELRAALEAEQTCHRISAEVLQEKKEVLNVAREALEKIADFGGSEPHEILARAALRRLSERSEEPTLAKMGKD